MDEDGLPHVSTRSLTPDSVWLGVRRCVYDDDCPLGTACIFVANGKGGLYKQSICADCFHIVDKGYHEDGWVRVVEALLGLDAHWENHVFTSASTGLDWDQATTTEDLTMHSPCHSYTTLG